MEKYTCIITGGNSGVGYESCSRLLNFDYHIVLACRDINKAEQARVELLKEHSDQTQIEVMQLDLNSELSIRNFANEFIAKNLKLKLLINNAGVSNSTIKPLNSHGVDETLYVNHFGTFLLTNLLIPELKKSQPSRIVNVNSSLWEKADKNTDVKELDPVSKYQLNPRGAYNISKWLSLMSTSQLRNTLKDSSVSIVSMCPGFVPTTNLGRDANFILKLVLNYIFPLFPFTSTLDQAANRVIISSLAGLDSLTLPSSEYSTLMYSKDKFEWIYFDEAKVTELWEHSIIITNLDHDN